MRKGDNRYFASLPPDEITAALCQKVDNFYDWNKSSGRSRKIRKAYAMALGATVDGTDAISWQMTRGGDQGELLQAVENHFGSICTSLLNLTTANRPAVQCSAANTDARSLAQTQLGDGLIEYHLSERELATLIRRATKSAIQCSEGFILGEWDARAGEPFMPDVEAFMARLEEDPEAGQEDVPTIMTGEPKFTFLGPLDVIRDESAESFASLRWIIARTWESKHELAARYHEMTDDILGLEAKNQRDRRLMWYGGRPEETDLIACYHFFHKKGSVMKDGREVTFLSDKIKLFDGPLAYRNIPIARIMPDEVEGTPFGHTHMFDLLGPQDTVNSVDSQIATNTDRGIGNLLVPRRANISVEQLATSMNAVEFDGDQEPRPLEFPNTPPEFYSYKAAKITAMETLSGVNSVVRGNPSESVGADSSGAKLALIEAQAIRSNSGLDRSHADGVRDVGMMIINLYRDFGGAVPRMARIAGKNNAYLLKEFTSSDLSDIERVKVDIGNPVLRTPSGKMTIADKAVELGLIKPGELDKYIHLLKEGTADPLFENKTALLLRIRQENEGMMEGKPHHALLTDPHWQEIPEHLAVLDNPAMREPTPENQTVQQAVLGAVQEHIDLFMSMPPALVMFRGGAEALAMWQQVQSFNAPAPPPGNIAAPGAPPPAPGGAEEALNPEAMAPELPNLPNMPTQPGGQPAGEPVDQGTIQ